MIHFWKYLEILTDVVEKVLGKIYNMAEICGACWEVFILEH